MRPGRSGASVCARRPGSAAPAPAPAAQAGLAGEGRRLGSPLPRGTEPPRSSAGGASFPRPLRLAPLFSPGPLRPAAEPRRPLGSARGCAPGTRRRGRAGTLPAGLGPSKLPGKGLPWSRGSGIRGGAAGGPQPAGVFRAVRSAAGSPLPAPFSRALPLFSSLAPPAFFFPFYSPLVSFHPAFSQPVCCLCLFPLYPPPFSLPVAAFPHLHLLFAFFFLYLSLLSCLSLFLFPLLFPSEPRPFQLSCFPLLYPFPSEPRPASLSGPRLPSGVSLPSGRKGLSGVCLLWGRRGAATATFGPPHPHPSGGEGGDSNGKGPL